MNSPFLRFIIVIMKTQTLSIYFSIILLSFFGCTPKFTELNDQGFGGVFNKKATLDKSTNINNSPTIKTSKIDSTNINAMNQINERSNLKKGKLNIKTTSSTISFLREKSPKIKKTKTFFSRQKNKTQTEDIIPNEESSFYRWYFFGFAVASIIGTLYLIIESTGPGAGSSGGVLALLVGIIGVLGAYLFLNASLNIDEFIEDRCLLSKIAIIIWWIPFLSIPFFLIGSIYDKFHR